MREIKVKGICRRTKKIKIIPNELLFRDDAGDWYYHDPKFGCNCGYCSPERFYVDVVQFTGLLDKQGKEIYEGDIVKHIYEDEIFGKVVWNISTTGFNLFNWISKEGLTFDNDFETTLLEVIGNIYENPELLESEK